MLRLIEKDIRARDIVANKSLENAARIVACTGGSTNAALHLPAIADEAGIDRDLFDVTDIMRDTPWFCDLRPAPGGRFVAKDLYEVGGVPVEADDHALTTFHNLHFGFVFQFHNLLPDFTALENVIFPTAVREGRETQPARARGPDLLIRMGLADRVDFPSANLSGGQKQRVAVARALMNSPELVLADEPTGNLDRASATQVMALIAEINCDDGTTFLISISTHDEKIAATCRRKIVVGDGLVTG